MCELVLLEFVLVFCGVFFLLWLRKVFVMIGPDFILHFLILFPGGSLMVLKCSLRVQFHIAPRRITDVMQLHLV